MHHEEMATMEQLLQLYEGLHETVRRNELIVKAIYAGFVLLALVFNGLSHTILNNPEIRGGIALNFIPVLLLTLYCSVEGGFLVKRLKAESKEAKSKLKEVMVLTHEYRQTLADLNPIFLKAVDIRLLRL